MERFDGPTPNEETSVVSSRDHVLQVLQIMNVAKFLLAKSYFVIGIVAVAPSDGNLQVTYIAVTPIFVGFLSTVNSIFGFVAVKKATNNENAARKAKLYFNIDFMMNIVSCLLCIISASLSISSAVSCMSVYGGVWWLPCQPDRSSVIVTSIFSFIAGVLLSVCCITIMWFSCAIRRLIQ